MVAGCLAPDLFLILNSSPGVLVCVFIQHVDSLVVVTEMLAYLHFLNIFCLDYLIWNDLLRVLKDARHLPVSPQVL